MSKLGRWLLDTVYRGRLKKLRCFETAGYAWKYRLRPFLKGEGAQGYRSPTWRGTPGETVSRVALIADPMTLECFRGLDGLRCGELRPQSWRDTLEELRPQCLFCESAWHGSDGSWDYRVHRNKRLLFDNRTALRRILRYCAEAGIPTVFWNKEDPTFFDDPVNSFSDTARLFDHVFTTCAETIPRYAALGVEAGTLMFGFSPRLFFPIPLEDGEKRAFFFGGWYADQPERCRNMRRVFDFVLHQGLELSIFDRYGGAEPPEENNRFPAEYAPYLRPPVPYAEGRGELAHAAFVVNVTTETNSETMFSRRVFEAMACARLVISNDSRGMRSLFPHGVWFVDEPFDPADYARVVEENRETVFRRYTFGGQLAAALSSVGLKLNQQEKDEETK